jgi:dolichyl-phosphate-mannose-protein mannosyltransferase
MGFGGGLLHSHVQTYPTGSQQQQVTCYHYRDVGGTDTELEKEKKVILLTDSIVLYVTQMNNDWMVTPLLHEPAYNESQPIKFLKHGSVIRLVHVLTGRNLHTHTIPAPITTLNHEVAGYGNATIDDSSSYWLIEVVDDMIRGKRKNFENINILSTRFRIRNLNLGCYLRAANAVLPQWGFKQVEVSCDKQNDPNDHHTYWNVESHINPRRK